MLSFKIMVRLWSAFIDGNPSPAQLSMVAIKMVTCLPVFISHCQIVITNINLISNSESEFVTEEIRKEQTNHFTPCSLIHTTNTSFTHFWPLASSMKIESLSEETKTSRRRPRRNTSVEAVVSRKFICLFFSL